MFISIVLLLSSSVFRGSLKINKFFMAILIYQLIMIIYLFTTADSTILPKYLPFHLYVIVFSFILIKNRDIGKVNFLPILFVISSFLTIISAFVVYLDLVSLDKELRREEAVLEVFTLDMASYANLIAGICLLRGKRFFYRVIIWIFILIDVYVVIKSGKRSYFVAIIMAVGFYLYKNRLLFTGLKFGIGLAVISFLLFPQVRDSTIEIINRTIKGFAIVYSTNQKSPGYDENDSATIRKYNQKKLLKDVEENFEIIHVFTGKGYLYAFIDNPLLESFLDMGLLGFFYYFYIILVMPFLFFKKTPKGNDFDMFIFLNSIVNITVIITNNNPYEYFVYTPACLIAMRYYNPKARFSIKQLEKANVKLQNNE